MRARLKARRVAEEQDGFTLVELLVVLAIVGVILAGITQLLTSALKSQTDQTNRTQAQQDARLSLDKLRREIRCGSALAYNSASSVTVMLPSYCPSSPPSPSTFLSSGVTLPNATITVASTSRFNSATNTISFGSSGTVTCTRTTSTSFMGCSGGLAGTYSSGTTVTSPKAAVTWCATTTGPPYQLKRYVGNTTVAGVACTGSGGVSWTRWLASSSVFTSYSGPPLTTLSNDQTLPAPGGTIAVADTSTFTSPYTISLGSSGTVTCTGKAPTFFSGCSGGFAGTYSSGTQVFEDGAGPPLTTLNVSLVTDQTPANAAQRFTLGDAISLRNSRRY